jgi:hypothetical protein
MKLPFLLLYGALECRSNKVHLKSNISAL